MSNRRAIRWIVPLLALAAVVFACGYLFAPRRITEVTSVDGEANWAAAEAPPRRQIVWQRAEAIAAVGLELAEGDSVIRPQLADGGATLYFTLRRAGGDADIFRARRIDGQWQDAVPLESINSDSEDIGPVLANDGRTLFLYSNRPGGFGGFDLFVSRRAADAWSMPENLGARINSVADEYDPAVSPDGKRLFFSSNRSEQLHERIASDGGTANSNDWPATLRVQATSASFDLYLSELSDKESNWQIPRSLVELNRNNTSEGAPFVSPNGAFLYFVSNRAERAGETTNFDIYRARVDGSNFLPAENLGTGVNSAANEMEPALSDEGFRLYFSRNNVQIMQSANEQYALFTSTATEITETISWDDSNLRALLTWFTENWWWMVLAALLGGLLAGLIWYLRQVSLRRATVPGFFLSALLIHLLLVGSLFVVALDDNLRNRIKKEVQELVVAVQLDSDPKPKESEPEYGNQADSQTVETVEPTDVERKAVEAPPVEAPSDNPRPAPAVPSELPFAVPPEQTVATQPELKSPSDSPQLARREMEIDHPAEMVETLEVQPVESTAENEPRQLNIDRSRTRPIAELTASPKQQTPPDSSTPLRTEAVPMERSAVQPASSIAATDAPSLVRKATRNVAMAETKVETTDVAAAQPSDSQSAPESAAVNVARQMARDTSTPITSRLPRRTMQANVPAFSSETVPVERAGEQPLEVSSPSKTIELARADRPSLSESPTEHVPTESVAGPVTPRSSNEPATTVIQVARQATQNSVNPASISTRPESSMPQSPTLTSDSVVAEQAAIDPVKVSPRAEPLVLARAERSSPQSDLPSEAVPTESVNGPETPNNEFAAIGAAVNLTRNERPSDLVPRKSTPTNVQINAPISAESVRPAPAASEIVDASPTDTPTELAMLRRPASAAIESTSDAIETIVQAAREAGGASSVDPSQSQAVNVQRAGESSPNPKSLPAGMSSATADRQLALDQSAIEVAASESTTEPRSADISAPLARASTVISGDVSETIATEAVAANVSPTPTSATTGLAVSASRSESQLVDSIKKQVGASGLLPTGEEPQLELASLNRDASPVEPAFGRMPNSLTRNTDRSERLPFAEDDIGLQAMLRLRQSEAKKDLLEAFGGNMTTESAVESGLNWMELHQHEDGEWSLNRFTQLCEKHHKAHKCNGVGGPSDTAATGFALLPFLGAGHTHKEGKHQEAIGRGLKWLVDKQKPNGDLFVGGGGNTHMYSHGIATIALCEAYAMTRDPALQAPAQKAIDFIVAAQHPTSGGWRYTPKQDGDTSVFGWQVMALKSGQMAELNVPQVTLDKARLWLTKVGAKGQNEGRFGYTNSSPTLTMTAEGLLCLQYLGGERNDPRLIAGSKFLGENLPTKETSYYWYYGTQVMFHMQGEPWQKWNAALQKNLVDTQVKQGSMAGTWDPKDNWEKSGGRVYSTALRLLMLEVYYRHLPLYQVLDQ